MPRVGRRRTKNFGLPAGVTEKDGTWYWQPTTERERQERRALREKTGEPVGCTLGPADSLEARKKWAEVTGRADPAAVEGTVAELLLLWKRDGLKKRPNGKPRADSTIQMYGDAVPVLIKKFGTCKYGRTEFEASRGLAIGTPEIQDFISEHEHPTLANRYFAVLDNTFQHAIRKGKTTYNPCDEVVKNEGGVREREPQPWEVEVLRTLAGPRLGLQMDFEAIVGWRIVDMRTLLRAQGTGDGVRVRYKKPNKRWLWEWSDELRRIWREAEQLPGASKFPKSPVFPTPRGGIQTHSAFDGTWQRLKGRANRTLAAAGVIDPDTLRRGTGITIEDLQFRDLRSKAHDDAEDAGIPGFDLLGNTESVSDRHYKRRARRMRPLK